MNSYNLVAHKRNEFLFLSIYFFFLEYHVEYIEYSFFCFILKEGMIEEKMIVIH